jgi:hypothetical protein
MILWLSENSGTIIVSLILIGIVAAIVAKLVKDKKRGKSICGNSCESCGMKDSCNNK